MSPPPAGLVLQDTFARANQSGWGTASDGNMWSAGSGLSIATNEGAISSSGGSQYLTLGSVTTADSEGLVQFSVKASNETAGIILRKQASGAMYLGRYDGAGSLEVKNKIGSNWSLVKKAPFPLATNTLYWLRFQALGNNLNLKGWADGTAEPISWNVGGTSSGVMTAGQGGLYGWAASASSIRFSSFSLRSFDRPPSPPPTPPAPGSLYLTTQARTGVVNGPPNNQTETDVNWNDLATGNGWQVGVVPGYGGSNVSFWSEIDAGIVGPTQTALNTTTPCGLMHDFSNRGGVYTGSEDYAFTTIQSDSGVWVSFSSTVPASGSDSNGFTHHVTTYIYPGDPGLTVQRFDLTNSSGAPIDLLSTDSLELAMIGCLQQVDSTWQPANGVYGGVGRASGAWPAQTSPATTTTLTAGDPDYYYITPAAGSAVKLGVAAVRKTGLSVSGGSNLRFGYLQNSHRLKVFTGADLTTFPAGVTMTFYALQVLSRNLSVSSAGIAADYLNPDNPAMQSGTFNSFSYDDGAYHFTTATGSSLLMTMNLTPTVSERWLTAFRVANWTGTIAPGVSIDGLALTAGVDYVSSVDTAGHTAHVKLLKPLAGSSLVAGTLKNGQIGIG